MEGLIESIKKSITGFEKTDLDEVQNASLQNRVDKKYVISISDLYELLSVIKDDYKLLYFGSNPIPNYQTYYFDTSALSLYTAHHNKRMNRYKVRKRHYPQTSTTFLEVKFKNNLGRTIKSRTQIDNFAPVLTDIDKNFVLSNTNLNASELNKSLEVKFKRMTFIRRDYKERVTIDVDLTFKNSSNMQANRYIAVVEVKQLKGLKDSKIVKELFNRRIIPRGFSKYCMGVLQTRDSIKYNNFKKKLLFLDRMRHKEEENKRVYERELTTV